MDDTLPKVCVKYFGIHASGELYVIWQFYKGFIHKTASLMMVYSLSSSGMYTVWEERDRMNKHDVVFDISRYIGAHGHIIARKLQEFGICKENIKMNTSCICDT